MYPLEVKIKVTGDTNIVFQNITKCVGVIGGFWFEFNGWCVFSQGDRISAIGKVDRGVIDIFWGRNWLREATIDKIVPESTQSHPDMGLVGVLTSFREKIVRQFREKLPIDESGLVEGLVFGQKSGISRTFSDKIKAAGVSHIVVASGYNVMLVAGILMGWMFWGLGRKPATLAVILILFFYMLMCGSQAPIVRAWWMAGISLVGVAWGRQSSTLWVLGLSAWLMFLIEPLIVIDVGFQLSVAACIGLMWLDPILQAKFSRYSWSGAVEVSGVRTSVSTLLIAAPVLIFNFGNLNLIGIVSNILILPIVPILTLLGFGMAVFGSVLTLPVYALSHLLVVFINWFGS